MAEIGGPLAHQLPLHSHRGGLVQPSLVMNHHLDLDCHGHEINISECRCDVQFIEIIATDEWYSVCLNTKNSMKS